MATLGRVVSAILLVMAVAWAVEAMRQSRQDDGEGPPMGAMCMIAPSILMLIFAGAIWAKSKRP